MSFHSKLFQIVCAVPAILIMLLGFPAVEARAADDLETRIDSLAEPLIEHGYTVGIVVALIENGNTRVFGYGKPSAQSDRKPDAQTIFEIGSVTKLFTALALADMVQRGKVSLEDPVEKYLPITSRSLPMKTARSLWRTWLLILPACQESRRISTQKTLQTLMRTIRRKSCTISCLLTHFLDLRAASMNTATWDRDFSGMRSRAVRALNTRRSSWMESAGRSA
jgi:hypothetical protein